jgi:hypothetical protein
MKLLPTDVLGFETDQFELTTKDQFGFKTDKNGNKMNKNPHKSVSDPHKSVVVINQGTDNYLLNLF